MKRFDSSKLFKLACQDVVERFHLLISLLFVLVRSAIAIVELALSHLPACLLAGADQHQNKQQNLLVSLSVNLCIFICE